MSWDFNIFYSLYQLKDFNLVIGTFLLTIIMYLVILKYNKDIKLKLNINNSLPDSDGNFEYGSSRWMNKQEIKKRNIKFVWALSLPGKVAPVTSAKYIKETIYNILEIG